MTSGSQGYLGTSLPSNNGYGDVAPGAGQQPTVRGAGSTALSGIAVAVLVVLVALKALAGFILGLGIVKVLGLAVLVTLFLHAPMLLVIGLVALIVAIVAWHVVAG